MLKKSIVWFQGWNWFGDHCASRTRSLRDLVSDDSLLTFCRAWAEFQKGEQLQLHLMNSPERVWKMKKCPSLLWWFTFVFPMGFPYGLFNGRPGNADHWLWWSVGNRKRSWRCCRGRCCGFSTLCMVCFVLGVVFSCKKAVATSKCHFLRRTVTLQTSPNMFFWGFMAGCTVQHLITFDIHTVGGYYRILTIWNPYDRHATWCHSTVTRLLGDEC